MQIFCDFDGTITQRDTIVYLTEQFGEGPEFRAEILRRIHQGSLSITEAIRQELSTVRISWPTAVQALDRDIAVDPTFPAFVEWCRDRGHPLTVLSSGMEPVVRHFVGAWDLPIVAHQVEMNPEGWTYRPVPEHDKVRVLNAAARRGGTVVYIGDGASDVAAIPLVDRLFARADRYLDRYCQERGIPRIPFHGFTEIAGTLDGTLT